MLDFVNAMAAKQTKRNLKKGPSQDHSDKVRLKFAKISGVYKNVKNVG